MDGDFDLLFESVDGVIVFDLLFGIVDVVFALLPADDDIINVDVALDAGAVDSVPAMTTPLSFFLGIGLDQRALSAVAVASAFAASNPGFLDFLGIV